jgi:HSP20 family protein
MWRGSNGSNPVGLLRNEVDRLFADFFGPTVGRPQAGTPGAGARAFPALDVWERDNELFVEAEVPGLKTDDLDIAVVGNQLVIKGRRADFEEQGATFHRRERGVGEFTRTVELPVAAQSDGVQAKLSDGVLLITLPKAEAAKPRKVQVKS